MRFLLTPIDFSDSTRLVVEEAVKMARAFGAHIVLLYVARASRPAAAMAALIAGSGRREITDAVAERRLQKIKTNLLQRGIAAHAIRLEGDPAREIIDQAEKLDALCIVMGTRGYGASLGLARGSTVSVVLKGTVRPVVLVRRQAEPLTNVKAPHRTLKHV